MVMKSFVLSLMVLVSATFVTPTESIPQSRSIVFTHAAVSDVAGAFAGPDMRVVVTGDRVAALGPTSVVRPATGAQLVDASGKFLIPGLWDMHVHLSDA